MLTITLDRPARLNALRWEMVEGLVQRVADAWVDREGRVVVVTGAIRAFCSDDDIVDGMDDPGRDRTGLRHRLLDTATRGPHYELVRALLSVPKPVVASLNGPCHGAGWVIALACDFPGRPRRRGARRHPGAEDDLLQPGRRAAVAAPDRPTAGDGPAD